MKIIKFPKGFQLYNQNRYKGSGDSTCYIEAEKIIIIEIKGEKPKELKNESDRKIKQTN